MGNEKISGFLAYPSNPSTCGETIRQAVELINPQGIVSLETWEQCRVGGKLVVDEICKAIDSCQLFCADLTGMNANVMFELGYAIARNDASVSCWIRHTLNSKAQFEQLRVLTTVGYATYSNSAEIMNKFHHDRPYLDLEDTLYNSAIKRNLVPTTEDNKVLYLKSLHETEASVRVTNTISKLGDSGISVIHR